MRPGESTVLPYRQSTPRSPLGARSAIRHLHQSALFSRLLDPIFWVPQPRVLIQHPWVTGRLRPGPPRSDPRLGRTSHPASSSPVSAGAPASTSAAAGEPAWCLPLFCAVRALTTSIRGTTQGRGLCRVPRPADAKVPDGLIRHPRGRRRGPHTLGPLLWSTQGLRAASTCGPARARDPDPVPAPCVIPGPPTSSGTVSVRLSCARSHLGPLAPASTSAAAGEPARRLPLFCAVRALTTSACGTTQGRGLCRLLRPADSEVPDGQIRHPRGRRRGPHTLGPLLWSRPAAWTSFGPGKARF
ncbi:hypothetical protein NDU88_008154 [Pleurodeles waltl]|uniref:Uncharacterized protein n=1 Tax=Pleurodeles waltl TaxID=8319 RepID=A0AAV7QMT3_PLEWA|nr:hypothetical protein NDU88_008154 [Pleurodeles waltl]